MNANCLTSQKHPAKSGVALLTVLALLSIFGVVLVGFTYTIRMEEITMKQYADSVNVQEATEAGIQGVLGQLNRDFDPRNPHIILGRLQPRYVSLMDPWAVGYGGRIGSYVYDARSHQVDTRSEQVFRRQGLTLYPTPIPLGIDEDPPGDVTGYRQVSMNTTRSQQGDGAPGLKGIDDNLDGVADGDASAQDDDEDYRKDEDPYDLRRPDQNGGQFFFPPGTGYDADGDSYGVFDESAKININFAGNLNGPNGNFTYNLGKTPAELDLALFIYNRVPFYRSTSGNNVSLSAANAENLAKYIVNFRYGSTNDGGATLAFPGVDRNDDNGNNNPKILDVEEYSRSTDLSSFDGEPYIISGNELDDDGDGRLNEEDETYIGPSTESTASAALIDPFDHQNALLYRPGNKIDDNGNGFIDENNEGIDDPAEFNIYNPKGDDKPFSTVDELKLVRLMRTDVPGPKPNQPVIPSLFDILRTSTTIHGQSDEISSVLSSGKNEVAKINPNTMATWLATDIWSQSNPNKNRADFQYGPPLKMGDLLAIQVDHDGDFQLNAEADVASGRPNGIDDDGDGLVDEPSDDWDGNMRPSGDFDLFGEPDLGAKSYSSGSDGDGDGLTQDKLTSLTKDEIVGNNIILEIDVSNSGQAQDVRDNELAPGFVPEGDGVDNDGDGLIDDHGDFNGDGELSYDPEGHVSEDAWGDLNGDGYPGLGADPEADDNSWEGIINGRPDLQDDLLVTNRADDDFDGLADFYDPQVLAAMYAPELDNVDNDGDGEVDEIGERYIAAFDDDEDGRYDEDPPDFQLALNLVDFIDTWMPHKIADDSDLMGILGLSKDNPVLADGVTTRTFMLGSSRNRSFRMHPRMLIGPNSQSRNRNLFLEQMRLLLPNPPALSMEVTFEGIEGIRINEVFAKPVIRLEAEDALEFIDVSTSPVTLNYGNGFRVGSGNDDDGTLDGSVWDSNWGRLAAADSSAVDQTVYPGYSFLPDGFRNTLNILQPIVNLDVLAPSFIFGVTNVAVPQNPSSKVGTNPDEIAQWTFNNIPPGIYEVVIYLHPKDTWRPEVEYEINRTKIAFKSDTAGPAIQADPLLVAEVIQRDTARVERAGAMHFMQLPYRLTPANPALDNSIQVAQNGELEITITAGPPQSGSAYYETSFDRIELISVGSQYVELMNITTEDIDLSGWQVNTPYGHYLLPKNTIIQRMKPSFKKDDGDQLIANQGLPGTGVPFEGLLTAEALDEVGTPIQGTDTRGVRVEDNKILLANNKAQLILFINQNFPDVHNLSQRVFEPVMGQRDRNYIENSIPSAQNPTGNGPFRYTQARDVQFRVVDIQDDILVHNPADKYVTLYDPAGNYMDSFKYRTTFNNVLVDIPGIGNPLPIDDKYISDMVVAPGYRGMESFERADPTHFETVTQANRGGEVFAERSVPSSIKLDAKDAAIVILDGRTGAGFQRQGVGGYVSGNSADEYNRNVTRFSDTNSFPANDAHWGGWDFIGDYYEYEQDRTSQGASALFDEMTDSKAIAREAVAPGGAQNVQFYQQLGGFENNANVTVPNQVQYSAFVWRLGLRELIRAGYDPDVDDQLTIRVLGRKMVDSQGNIREYDMPVGEVMIAAPFQIVNPGENSIMVNPTGGNNSGDPTNKYVNGRNAYPVFAKLRNGDTAYTINLRETFRSLYQDLISTSEEEPMIEIMVVMRKTTNDISPRSNEELNLQNRPDLAPLLLAFQDSVWPPVGDGDYVIPGTNSYAGNMGDDNYFFKGIELVGRGRKAMNDSADENARMSYLGGTPGRDNTGYVPAYPRRRLDIAGTNRDEYDIIDNTAFVKNGPLATLGEISRLHTGNKFETINTPIIPQRLEDRAMQINQRLFSNPEIGKRARGRSRQYEVQLAQRERLDQWENQYAMVYDMITTADNVIQPGLININTAPREVLVALPFCPPDRDNPGQLERLEERHNFNTVCADFIIEGRQPGGHDMFFGVHDLDDDLYLSQIKGVPGLQFKRTLADGMSDYKLRSVGREPSAYKNFDQIEQDRLQPMGIKARRVDNIQVQWKNYFTSTIETDPDDGPYASVGEVLTQLTHLRRRDRAASTMTQLRDRTWDGKKDFPGDLRERLTEEIRPTVPLTTEDMEELMNRVSNLMTVRSRAFGIRTLGRVYDSDGAIRAQRKHETVYTR